MRVLAALLLPAAVLLSVVYVGNRLGNDQPESPVRSTAIVWADRVFTNRAELARWLRARGVRYAVWARRHPRVAAQASGARTAAAAPVRRRAVAAPHHQSDGTWRLLVGGLLALAAGAALAIVVPRRRGRPRLPRLRAPPRKAPRRPVPLRSAVRGAAVARVVTSAATVGRAFNGAASNLRAASRQAAFAVEHVRREHDDLAWYLAVCLLAAAIGVLLPYSLR